MQVLELPSLVTLSSFSSKEINSGTLPNPDMVHTHATSLVLAPAESACKASPFRRTDLGPCDSHQRAVQGSLRVNRDRCPRKAFESCCQETCHLFPTFNNITTPGFCDRGGSLLGWILRSCPTAWSALSTFPCETFHIPHLLAAIRLVKMILPRVVPQVASAVNCLPTIVVCSVMVSLAWIAVLLRLWTKVRIIKIVGWDDWIMLVATVSLDGHGRCVTAVTKCIIGIFHSLLRFGHRYFNARYLHASDRLLPRSSHICQREYSSLFRMQLRTNILQLLNVAEVFYVLSLLALKISLSVFFLRLTVQLWQRRVVLVALAVSSSFSVLMFFFVVFQCGVYKNTTVFLLRRFSNQCASNSFTLGMTYTHAIITTLTVSCGFSRVLIGHY